MSAETNRLDRREVVHALLADREGLLVVSGLGAPSWDITAVGDNDLNFPLWGAMGGAAMLGLGLALAQPDRRVIVVTGDGEALMGMSSLATIGSAGPSNLGIAVLDNEYYGETGMQRTSTANGTDLAAVGAACGLPNAVTIHHDEEIAGAVELMRRRPGPNLAVFKISPDVPAQVVPPRDGRHLVARFRAALSAPA